MSRAALKLHISQPALSKQIRDLEDEIGFSLLERTAKSVRLTDAGRAFLDNARAVVSADTQVWTWLVSSSTQENGQENPTRVLHCGDDVCFDGSSRSCCRRLVHGSAPGSDRSTAHKRCGRSEFQLELHNISRLRRHCVVGVARVSLCSATEAYACPSSPLRAGRRSRRDACAST